MNPAIVFPMVFALILYTIAVYRETTLGWLTIDVALLFTCGVICDAVGTGNMYLAAPGHAVTLHGLAGYAALVIMAAHAGMAWVALSGVTLARALFNRFSGPAWFVWLCVFATGAAGKLFKA